MDKIAANDSISLFLMSGEVAYEVTIEFFFFHIFLRDGNKIGLNVLTLQRQQFHVYLKSFKST